MTVIALIPAKGVSTGMPGKNIARLGAHPVIAYSIAAARQCADIDRVIVSTDSQDIAAIARDYGADVPFMRPSEYAQDHTRDFDVFMHAAEWFAANEALHPELWVQLRPTSPLRRPGLVAAGIERLRAQPAADSVRSVCAARQNPFKMWLASGADRITPLVAAEGVDESYNAPRQVLPQALWQTGALDAFRHRTLVEQGSLTGTEIVPLMTDAADVVDIDSAADLEHAAALLEAGGWISPD